MSKAEPLSLVFIDVKKAFDSINHGAIYQALTSAGVPRMLVEYIRDLYSSSTTRIISVPKVSSPVAVNRGVKQDDPMSPFLFNLVQDTCLDKLGGDVQLKENLKLLHIAFADDVVLLAPRMDLLQGIFNTYTKPLSNIGLDIHPRKCQSFEVVVERVNTNRRSGGGDKKILCKSTGGLMHGVLEIPALSGDKLYKYLGIQVGVNKNKERKALYESCTSDLSKMLQNLSAAPLKPTQRLQILKVHCLPKFDHRLALSPVNKGLLERMDKLVRREVIRWLKLPRRGVPLEFYHSPVSYGGLRIRSFRGTQEDLNARRITLLERNNDLFTKWLLKNSQWTKRLFGSTNDTRNNTRKRPAHVQISSNANDEENSRDTRPDWASARYKPDVEDPNTNELYEKVGMNGLRWLPRTPQSSGWVDCWRKNITIAGRDYVRAIMIRGGLLPTPSRKHQIGLSQDNMCPTCPDWVGTPAHCIQSCPRSHGARIRRHDFILDYFTRKLRHQEQTVEIRLEPRISVGTTHLKPDLVFWYPQRYPKVAYCVDAAVCSEERNPNQLHDEKVLKYSRPEVAAWIRQTSGVELVDVGAIAMTWREAWAATSANCVTDFPKNFLRMRDLSIMSLRCLNGSWKCWLDWVSHSGGRPDRNRNRPGVQNRNLRAE